MDQTYMSYYETLGKEWLSINWEKRHILEN